MAIARLLNTRLILDQKETGFLINHNIAILHGLKERNYDKWDHPRSFRCTIR